MLKEFKEFAMKGNVVDMAVGVIIGGAFGKIVSSLVNDVLMPPLGLLIGNMDFSDLSFVIGVPLEGKKPVTVNYGLFVNNVINFLIVAFSIFLVIQLISKLQKPASNGVAAPTTKECPACLSAVALKATRCAFCTSNI